MADYHVFLSYARLDNALREQGSEGWVTAFHNHLLAQHQRYSGRALNVFFDKSDIRDNEDWERRIYRGLRTSSLFLAFLSPSYLKSPWCRREWEEYLRLEHTLARGDDGIQSIYFVRVPELDGKGASQPLDDDLKGWIDDINRRQRGANFDLRDWFTEGPALLREIDAAERIGELRQQPRSDRDEKLVGLAERIAHIDTAIAKRLDRATLAALAPGNLEASYEHFVGRSAELRQLHSGLIADRIGLIGALHGLGGQGKTALAIQYAYAYAESYAAGGRWLLPCEGRRELGQALEPLITIMGLQIPEPPSSLGPAEARMFQAHAIVAALRQWTHANVAVIGAQLLRDPRRHGGPEDLPEVAPHLLLILDNVDQTRLLSSAERALLSAEDWLQVIVTTRLDPRAFGSSTSLATIAVDDLPPADALALLREFRAFGSDDERAAARDIVQAFGGFTLAVELVGAYLAAKPDVTYRDYLARLGREGVLGADRLAEDEETRQRIRHRQAQIGFIIDDTIAALPPAAREALAYAALMPADYIVLDWLRVLTSTQHPELSHDAVRPGYPDPWVEVVRTLIGRRLVQPASFEPGNARQPRTVRLHRLVGQHITTIMPLAECEARVESLISLIDAVATRFEDTWRASPEILWQLRPLQEAVARISIEAPDSRALAAANSVAASAEFETGQLISAGQSFEESHSTLKRLLEANPTSAQAARDVSVSLDKLGDFYLRRGQSGDAERALECFEESNKTDKRLLEANPTSAEAARDVSVSHYKLAQIHMQAKHQSQAVEHLTACFAILDGFHQAGRPMDPAMEQLRQQLAGMLKRDA